MTPTAKECTEFIDHFFEELDAKSSAGDIVIVASNWWNTHRKLGDKEFAAAIGETLDRILQSGVKPVLVLNSPDFLKNPYEMTVKTGSLPGSERYFFTRLRDLGFGSSGRCEGKGCGIFRTQYVFYAATIQHAYLSEMTIISILIQAIFRTMVAEKVAQKMFETLADGALALKPK